MEFYGSLFQFQGNEEHADSATKEALQYNRALLEGYKSLRRCRKHDTHDTKKQFAPRQKVMRLRDIPGTALRHRRSGKIIYTPPVGEDPAPGSCCHQLGKILARAGDP